MLERYVKKILASRVYDVAQETPLLPAHGLSEKTSNRVQLKREDMQAVFSFKLRGSYNKMAQLAPMAAAQGVITASAGNHAQGVALAAQKLGLKAIVVMGRNTPEIKVGAVRRLGAKVVLYGDSYNAAADHAREMAAQKGLTYVHPFDDVDVIAGQGTVGMEILNQCGGALDAIYVPVGGGGLIAGIAAYVKYLRGDVRIIGVEAEGSACMSAALRKGRRVTLPAETLDLFADGVSVAQAGKETYAIARKYVDEMITVSTDEICAAVKDVFDDTRTIAEPAGALSIAGLKKHTTRNSWQDRDLVAIVSGANVNFDRLRHISERAELGEQREAILGVQIDERPGSFHKFCRQLGKRGITEFNYRLADDRAAQVYVGLSTGSIEDRVRVIGQLVDAGYAVEDMTENEVAKTHVRHMVGGRGRETRDELLFRFEFPERPGALLKFLQVLGSRWSISVFHYRNHGAAWGRALVGFAASDAQRGELQDYLSKVGYRYWEESDNSAYKMFLR